MASISNGESGSSVRGKLVAAGANFANGASGSSIRAAINTLLSAASIAAISAGDSMAAVRTKLNTLLTAALPTLTVTGGTPTAEGNSGTTNVPITATVNRNGVTGALAYTWAITGIGTNPASSSDFSAMSGSGTIGSGVSADTFNIAIVGDTAVEPNEPYRVTVTLTASGVSNSTDGSITNDDATAVYASPANSANVMVVGDSITTDSLPSGHSTTGAAISMKKLGISNVVVNRKFGVAGQQLAGMSVQPPTAGGVGDYLARYYNPSRVNIAISQRGVNDLGNSTAAQMEGFTSTAVSLYKSQGYYVIVCTILPSTGAIDGSTTNGQRRLDYNAWVVAGSSGADAVCDLASNSTMGASTAPANTSLYDDGLHPTGAGQDALVVTYQNAITPFLSMPIRFPASTPSRPPLIVTSALTYGAVKFGQGITAGQAIAPYPAPMTPPFPSTYECTVQTTASGLVEFMRQTGEPGFASWDLTSFGNNALCIVTNADGSGTFVNGPTPINDGNLHRVAVEFTSSATTVYVDGVAGSPGPAIARGLISTPLELIANTLSLDEVAVFSGTHGSASNISSAYAGTEANLLALYHLNGDVTDGRP